MEGQGLWIGYGRRRACNLTTPLCGRLPSVRHKATLDGQGPEAPLCGERICTSSPVKGSPFPSHLVAAHALVEVYEELARHELVGVHDVQQLLARGVLLLQVLPGGGGGECEAEDDVGTMAMLPWPAHHCPPQAHPFRVHGASHASCRASPLSHVSPSTLEVPHIRTPLGIPRSVTFPPEELRCHGISPASCRASPSLLVHGCGPSPCHHHIRWEPRDCPLPT